jgi:putative phosphoesterase
VRLGLMSDIHGNTVALDAVIADGHELGIDAWYVLGDLVAVGPEPVATLETLLAQPNTRFVRGNTDRYTVTGERPRPYPDDVARDPSLQELFDAVESSFAWTHQRISEAGLLDILAALPTRQRITLSDGTRVLAVHASVASDDGPGIRPDISNDELTPLIDGADADIVCGGHTHRATDRAIDGVRAVNLGSVSNPMTADLRASYVVIEDDDVVGHRLAHRWVAYDHAAVVERCFASGHPQADYIAGFQSGRRGH